MLLARAYALQPTENRPLATATYSPSLGRFTQPDTIIPDLTSTQSWNRFSYVSNNPINFNDPTGHMECSSLNCAGSDDLGPLDDLNYYQSVESATNDLVDYIEEELLNNKGEIKKDISDLDAMVNIVEKAAELCGDDWNCFLIATSYVFLGVKSYGAGTMRSARFKDLDFRGFPFRDVGFHEDFQDEDNQVRHFWAAFANAANPNPITDLSVVQSTNLESFGLTWSNIWPSLEAHNGNIVHDEFQDWAGVPDSTVMDYALSITAIDIGEQVGSTIGSPGDLASVLIHRLGTVGPGSDGLVQELEDSGWWRTPREGHL